MSPDACQPDISFESDVVVSNVQYPNAVCSPGCPGWQYCSNRHAHFVSTPWEAKRVIIVGAFSDHLEINRNHCGMLDLATDSLTVFGSRGEVPQFTPELPFRVLRFAHLEAERFGRFSVIQIQALAHSGVDEVFIRGRVGLRSEFCTPSSVLNILSRVRVVTIMLPPTTSFFARREMLMAAVLAWERRRAVFFQNPNYSLIFYRNGFRSERVLS